MAEILVPARGCVYVPRNTRGGQGFYALSPNLRGDQTAPILIEGVDGLEGDLAVPVATMDERKILYVYGEDFGNVAISGMVLLGKAEQNGDAFRKVVSYFNDHRVGVSLKPVSLSYPGKVAQKVFLTHLVVAKPDPQFHIQMFQFRAIAAEPLKA